VNGDGTVRAIIGKDEAIGEFPLLGESSTYTVTAVAEDNAIIAIVSYVDFEAIINKRLAEIRLRISRSLARRLTAANAARLENEVRGYPLDRDALTTPTHVVILVHGIRDRALWQHSIREALESEGVRVALSNYDRFSLFKFLMPFGFFRDQAIAEISKQLTIIKHNNPSARISIIAHSFGTYIISQLMRERFELKFHRIIFCGSVVPINFEFEQIVDRFTPPILNEVGARDPWPAIAESVTTGYGNAGTFGFRRTDLVRDRWHNNAGHGFFLEKTFCNKYWLPFLQDGTIVDAAKEPQEPSAWVEVLSNAKVKYIAVLMVAGAVFYATRFLL
jgi:hypothetical protein